MVNYGPPKTVPAKFEGRLFYQHNPSATLMRTTREENSQLGEIVAAKLNEARGPVRFVMPLGGVSAIDRKGQPFHDPVADGAFLMSLKHSLSPRVGLTEVDAHINDPLFADKCVKLLLELLRHTKRRAK
jgi:uncharacterized protein (UPF0261 family)